MAACRERGDGRRRRAESGIFSKPSLSRVHCHCREWRLVTQGLETVDIGSISHCHVTRLRPKDSRTNVSSYSQPLGNPLFILKEIDLTLMLVRRPLKICVLFAIIMNEFILRLDMLYACDASVVIGRRGRGSDRRA
jgi:hypothetical protein